MICLLCPYGRQTKTMFGEGRIDECLRICVRHGIDPITAKRLFLDKPRTVAD